MKIRINKANVDKMQAAIDAVEGRATARKIDARTIDAIATIAEERIEALLLTKKMSVGAVVNYQQGIKLPVSRFRHTADATSITIVRGASGWFLTAVHRGYCYHGQGEGFDVTLSAEQAAFAKARFAMQFAT